MNYKKQILTFFLLNSLILSIIPLVNIFSGHMKEKNKSLYDTDVIEGYINYFAYKHFNFSMNTKSVIAGKNNFLFLGNKYNDLIQKSRGLLNLDTKIKFWVNKLNQLGSWYKHQQINMLFIAVPNKHSIYQEFLPNWIGDSSFKIPDLINNMIIKENVNFIDLRPHLINSKNKTDKLIYLKTDTHWNAVGASVAYRNTINYLNTNFQTDITPPDYEINNYNVGTKDLSGLLKMNRFFSQDYENLYKFEFDKNNRYCIGHIDIDNLSELSCINNSNNGYSIIKKPKYTNNLNANSKLKVLIIADSFFTRVSQLYSKTFSKVWAAHYDYLNGNMLESFLSIHKPDIVLYLVVERNFLSGTLVKPVSSIINVNNKDLKINSKIFNFYDGIFNTKKYKNFNIKDQTLFVTHRDPKLVLNGLKANSNFILLRVNIDSNKETMFQIFYKEDSKEKYSQNNSYSASIKKGENLIVLKIPSKYLNNGLRVDLVNSKGNYQLKDFSIFELDSNR